MALARGRLGELWHPLAHRRSYKKLTEIALEIAQPREEAEHGPQAQYAFAHGLCTLVLARFLASVGKHGGSAGACARPTQQ
jgi:hypothetical protein